MSALDLSLPSNRNLVSILKAHADSTPDAVFLLTDEGEATYGATYAAVERLAGGLHEVGIRKGDRVTIVMAPGPDYVRLVLAINRIGGIWVPINAEYRGAWLSDAISDTLPAAIVVDAELLPRLDEVRDSLPDSRIIVRGELTSPSPSAISFAELCACSSPAPPHEISYGDTAAILWTSGTTGRPKGVMQSHNVWIRAGISSNRLNEARPGDVIYSCLPLYNSAAWSANIFPALVGGIGVAIDSHFSVRDFWSRVRKFGATQTMSLGAMHMFLWNAPPQPDDADNPLRTATMVPMPEDIIGPFCRRFGIDKIIQGYGQSEVMTLISRWSGPNQTRKANALGTSPEFQVRLLGDDGCEVDRNMPGEFAVLPPGPFCIFNGYFNQPEATAAAFTDGWYRTGDLGIQDSDGDFFFVDRKKDYIRYKGRSISSFQIESVAAKHPSVAQAAAYGIASAEIASEHEIKLDVVLREGCSIDLSELAQFINENAPYFFVPRYVEIVEAFPHTPTNKVEKYKLRAKGVGPDSWDRLATDFIVRR